MKKWLNRHLGMLSLALSNVEKNSLSQTNDGLANDATQSMRLTQGKISDSLVNGEITEEVINLRARMYKILTAVDGVTSKIVGYDEDNLPIVETIKKDKSKGLKNILLDKFDSYSLEMVIDNSEITLSKNDVLDNEKIVSDKENIISGDTTTYGAITGGDYFATNKPERPIKIFREEAPNFEIETYTKQLKIRYINETQRLLEFYVSAYPDEYNRTTRLFISNVKKAIEKPYSNSMLEIKEVEFVTHKNLGVDDFLYFKFDIESFDKIVEFNGFYVIKFIAKITNDGENIFEKYKSEELEKKYEKKLKK